jgi:hypothetical protein
MDKFKQCYDPIEPGSVVTIVLSLFFILSVGTASKAGNITLHCSKQPRSLIPTCDGQPPVHATAPGTVYLEEQGTSRWAYYNCRVTIVNSSRSPDRIIVDRHKLGHGEAIQLNDYEIPGSFFVGCEGPTCDSGKATYMVEVSDCYQMNQNLDKNTREHHRQ